MIINASIQVVPIGPEEAAYPVIDKAIALIQQSGLKYTVGGFATEIEGEYEPVLGLMRTVTDYCYSQQGIPFLIYTKLHLQGGRDILREEKVGKFS